MIKATIIFTISLLFCQSSFAKEQILNFDSDIKIHEDASLTITESIIVQAEGKQVRHGIYRDFPTNYQDKLGNNYQVAFDIKSITKDGLPVQWFTTNLRNGVRVYVGSKQTPLPEGIYNYKITYKTNNQLGYFESFDELFWNVTGNDWKFPINHVTATVQFPTDIDPSNIGYKGYTGYGEQGGLFRLTEHTKSYIRLETRKPLHPTEDFTIAINWPKGYVKELTKLDRTLILLGQNLHLIIFILGLLVVIVYHLIVWLKVGRDPRPGVIIPIYDPPEKESPAAVRYIMRNHYDYKTFTTALISLAVKGYLTIEEDESKERFIFTRTGKSVNFSAGEKVIAEKLFSNETRLSTKEASPTIFNEALHAHKKSLEQDYKKKYFKLNLGYLFVGLLLSTLFIIIGIIFKHPFANISISALITIGLHLITNFVFGLFIKAPTVVGRVFMDKAEGLKQYLTIAETDQLRQQYPLNKTPSNFERYLPYAFALDIEKTWADYFGEQLSHQFVREDGATISTPLWFNSTNSSMNLNAMTNQLSTQVIDSVVASTIPPGSVSGSSIGSGSFGGGFSGGAGGGGGGGGW